MYDYSNYNYDYNAKEAANIISKITSLSLSIVFGILAIVLILAIIIIIAKYKLYKKAGKKGWEAIVPFYSQWVYVEIAGLNWWWFLIIIGGILLGNASDKLTTLGSLVSLFGLFVCNYNIAKKFHKDTGFAVLMTLFPVILLPMLGFSKEYVFDSSIAITPNGPFDSNKNTNTVNNSSYNNVVNTPSEPVNNTINNEVKTETTKFCPNCGTNVENNKFCPNCGKQIN